MDLIVDHGAIQDEDNESSISLPFLSRKTKIERVLNRPTIVTSQVPINPEWVTTRSGVNLARLSKRNQSNKTNRPPNSGAIGENTSTCSISPSSDGWRAEKKHTSLPPHTKTWHKPHHLVTFVLIYSTASVLAVWHFRLYESVETTSPYWLEYFLSNTALRAGTWSKHSRLPPAPLRNAG